MQADHVLVLLFAALQPLKSTEDKAGERIRWVSLCPAPGVRWRGHELARCSSNCFSTSWSAWDEVGFFFAFFFSPFAVERSNFPRLLLSSSALVWAALTDAFISQTEMK